MTALFPPTQRGRALGGIGSVVALGLTLGPPLGGFIVQRLSWRWIFLPNLPIGVAGALWAARVLPGTRPAHPSRLDRIGALLLAAAVGTGVGAIQASAEGAARSAVLAAASLARPRSSSGTCGAPRRRCSSRRSSRAAPSPAASWVGCSRTPRSSRAPSSSPSTSRR